MKRQAKASQHSLTHLAQPYQELANKSSMYVDLRLLGGLEPVNSYRLLSKEVSERRHPATYCVCVRVLDSYWPRSQYTECRVATESLSTYRTLLPTLLYRNPTKARTGRVAKRANNYVGDEALC